MAHGGGGGGWADGPDNTGGQGWDDTHGWQDQPGWDDTSAGHWGWADPAQNGSSYGYAPAPPMGGKRGSGGGSSGLMTAVVSMLIVVVLGLAGALVYFFLRPDSAGAGGAGQAASGDTTSGWQTVPNTLGGEASQGEATVTVTRDAQSSQSGSSQSSRNSDYPAGADSSGWIDNRQSRCRSGDDAVMIGRSSQASFSICTDSDTGRYYYRGSASGLGLEVADPTVKDGEATVVNGGVIYQIWEDRMAIYQSGELISDQEIVTLWTR